jgi:hypothetical protein
MPTSRTTFVLSDPTGREPLPPGVLQYMQTRNRMHAFTLVQQEFERSGITQAELAARLGKGADVVCRILGAPGNWTLDTVSDYLWAISGAEIQYKLSYPLDKPCRNMTVPEWLYAIPLEQPEATEIKLNNNALIQVPLDNSNVTATTTIVEYPLTYR